MINSFDDISVKEFRIDNLNYCLNDNYASGLNTKVYFAPATYFSKIDLPLISNSYGSILNLNKQDIEFKNRGWVEVDVLIGENELKQNLTGALQRKKNKTELEFFILGFKSKVLGFIEKHKNIPIVLIVVDAVGNNWLIGNLRNRAFFENADISTQRKYEDNSGAVVKVTCNSPIYYFGNDKSWIIEDLYQGDFSFEFTKEYV